MIRISEQIILILNLETRYIYFRGVYRGQGMGSFLPRISKTYGLQRGFRSKRVPRCRVGTKNVHPGQISATPLRRASLSAKIKTHYFSVLDCRAPSLFKFYLGISLLSAPSHLYKQLEQYAFCKYLASPMKVSWCPGEITLVMIIYIYIIYTRLVR